MKGPSSAILVFSILILMFSSSSQNSSFKGVGLGNPTLDVIPSILPGHLSHHGSKDVLLCERVQVAGLSRLKLGSYASSFRVTVAPSVVILERLHSKILVCFHGNASLGLCQSEKDEWKTVQKGLWNFVMSPYEDRYVDVKFIRELSGSVTVSVEEDFQRWRLFCLALGFFFTLASTSCQQLGSLLLQQFNGYWDFAGDRNPSFSGNELLPTGRKNVFYLTIYGSVLGAGSFLLHQFSMLVNTILVNFGLSEVMHNPVSIFALVGLVLAGAALGYWIVRKFVISEDGSVDVGVAQFVKWGMRLIATTFILQSTLDTLALGALVYCWAICILITSPKWRRRVPWGWKSRQAAAGKTVPHMSSTASSDSPDRGVIS